MTMNRITGHHAASGYKPSKESLEAYHRLIDGDGQVIAGNHEIEDNAPGRTLSKGTYAAHTWKLNSGNIGVSILAMASAVWGSPRVSTKSPVRLVQVDAYCREVARLAIDYSIPVDRRFVLTHAEVQPTLGVTQKNKWDFDYDPRYRSMSRDPIAIGDELRKEISRIMKNMRRDGAVSSQPAPSVAPVGVLPFSALRQGSKGPNVLRLQDRLGLLADGVFGPKTRDAVIAFQKTKQLLPDGVVGAMTWATLFPTG